MATIIMPGSDDNISRAMETTCSTCPIFLRTSKKCQFICPGKRIAVAKKSIQMMRYIFREL